MSASHITRIVEKEGGFALVIALLLMLVGTAIGIFGVTSGVIETRIAGNMRLSDNNLYGAEGGTHIAAVIVNDITDEFGNDTIIGPRYANPFLMKNLKKDDGTSEEQKIEIDLLNLIQEVYDNDAAWLSGLFDCNAYRDPALRNPDSALDAKPDIRSQLGTQRRTDIDVDRINTKGLSGGGIEFLSGYDGIGSGGGAAGGVQILFSVDSYGTTTDDAGIPLFNSRANVEVIFRKIPNVSGGQ